MSIESYLALSAFAFAAAFTPGPNNALAASWGAQFGFRAVVPHIFGIGLGFPLMICIIALGLGQLFQQSTILREGLRIAGAAFLLYLAWRIATSGSVDSDHKARRPFTFLQSAGFQWINPKGWVMTISVVSQFSQAQAPVTSALIISGVFVIMGFASASTWAGFGTAMQRILTSSLRLRVFNVTMAGLIVLSVLGVIAAELG